LNNFPPIGNFIHIIGTSGSGKTSLAHEIAKRLNIKHIELDALHWGPNWTEPPIDEFKDTVSIALQRPQWIVDGSYGKVRHMLWEKVDTVIWLDYSLPIILFRLFRRTIARTAFKKRLWNDNQESFSEQFFSRESLFLWTIQTYPRRKKQYPQWFKEYPHITVIRLTKPSRARALLKSLQQDG
jgi:adenylate kinase family enzyme